MSSSQKSKDQILAKIHAVAFGTNEDFRENSLFIKELRAFRKFLERNSRESVTLPAIAGWFRPDGAEPTRIEALQFLHGYLLWTTGRQAVANRINRSALDALANDLLRTIEFERSGYPREPAPAQEAKRSDRGRKPWADQRTTEKLKTIAGVYQIIRPYTSRVDWYVLEVMSINAHAVLPDQVVLMYSHTQPKKEYLYSGAVSVNNKYCFGMLSRKHEDHESLRTPRSIVIDISAPQACISGIMLRGVTGRSGQAAIAVPFVAIRSPCDVGTLQSQEIERLDRGLNKIQDGLLIGEIGQSDQNEIFEFCDQLFKQLKSPFHNSNGFTLQTINSMELCRLINPSARTDDEYFVGWKSAVAIFLSSDAKNSGSDQKNLGET